MPARLRISDHPAAIWAEAAKPWLRGHGANWRTGRTILAPNAGWVAALKGRAVEEGLPVLGVEWLTPGRWRAKALAALPGPARRVALREDLHLLLELAAAQLPDNPLARAYGADPAAFQEVLDLLEGAGWSAEVLDDPAARELALRAIKLRAQTGWMTSAGADHLLREMAGAGKLPQMGQTLLAVGFGSGDWALRPLLEAASAAYRESEFVFDVVDYEQTVAAAWVGSWEEKLGETAEWLEVTAAAAPFAPIAEEILQPLRIAAAKGTPAPTSGKIPQLWLADNLQAEADLVVAQALAYLQEAKGEHPRVGIVVGSVNSPLAREVAARLTALGLPHHNAPGHLPGRGPAQTRFEAWLDWQEHGRLAALVAWVRAAAQTDLLRESAEAVEKALGEAAGATLSDDPSVLAAWLAAVRGENNLAGKFLSAWPRLPELADFDIFIQKILGVAEKICWPEPPKILEDRAASWAGALNGSVARAAVVRWVRAVTRVPGRTRDALGREPWAALQITDAAGAAAQTWTHLVLGGLQHGEWPADDRDSPLLDDAIIAALNRKTLRQGPQGEGHWTVASARGLLMAQGDRRKLERAAFARLVALPTQGLALTARLMDPADGRPARLSEYFWTVAKMALGRLPMAEDWESLAATGRSQRETFHKVLSRNSPKLFRGEKTVLPEVGQTQRAYRTRRDAAKKFDEYSFCLKSPPAKPLQLSCKNWEEAVAKPGASWFAHLLKLGPRWDPAADDFTRRSLGTWAHEWVRPGPRMDDREKVRESLKLPSLDLWRADAMARAEEVRAQVAAAFAAARRPLPESWLDAWAAAARLAEQWMTVLAEQPDWPQALAEATLPEGLQVALPGPDGRIPLTGRMDLVLFPRPVVLAPGQLSESPAWLLDFKTGNTEPLKKKKIAKGEGLQLALYALALRELGAGTVALTLLNREAEAREQLTSADLAAPEMAELWKLLADFAVGGCWGDRSDLANEYREAGEYPAATLPVSAEILRQKWQLTHTSNA